MDDVVEEEKDTAMSHLEKKFVKSLAQVTPPSFTPPSLLLLSSLSPPSLLPLSSPSHRYLLALSPGPFRRNNAILQKFLYSAYSVLQS